MTVLKLQSGWNAQIPFPGPRIVWLVSHMTVLKLQSDWNAQIPFPGPRIVT